ncbi:MAG TPA: family 1 encapsulin nanocompartment shell protein [Myxococcota bacterium]|nr:family 1 encapsulin nanocompartment shell protein [Myxococcota bacterium]
MNRHLAPISDTAWRRIESEARDMLTMRLAARRLVDFEGPFGWLHSGLDLGRAESLECEVDSRATIRRRVVRPLIELRVPFTLERQAIERADRGASRIDLDPLREAARVFAAAEDDAIFEGYADADIPGLITDSTNEGVAISGEGTRLADAVAEALEQLRRAGVSGPYVVALGPEAHKALARASGAGGYPMARHVRGLVDRDVIWAATLRGGVVASLRGGDFRMVCGRDAAIGYVGHDDDHIRLYLEESFTAELTGPEAAVPLLPPDV